MMRAKSNSSVDGDEVVIVAAHRKYEIFLSYDKSVEDKVKSLHRMLTESFDVSVCIDDPDIDFTMRPQYKKLMRNILRSKIAIFCVNKEFTCSKKCKDKVIVAYTNSRPLIFLLLQNLSTKDLGPIFFAFDGAPKLNIWDSIGARNPWSNSVISELLIVLQNSLGRRVSMSRLNERRRGLFLKVDSDMKPSANERSSLSSGVESTRSSISSVKEKQECEDEDAKNEEDFSIFRFERSPSIFNFDSESKFIDPSSINFEMSKFNSLFENAYGYNRMVYLESKKRYLATSSYHKTIVCIDKGGNWIEKRNPGGVIKQPFAICVSSRNEVFVGDNELKCIFLFDDNLKLLRTFAEKIVGGFTDIAIDNESRVLYTVHIYDSLVVKINIEESAVTSRFHISAPTFIRLFPQAIVVLTTDDLIYIVDKKTHELKHKIELKNSKFSSALCTYRDDTIFVTAYEFRFNRTKSKNVFLCVVKINDSNNSVQIKKVDIDIHQVNDMILTKNSLTCIDDTHFIMFKFDDIDKLLLECQQDLYGEDEY